MKHLLTFLLLCSTAVACDKPVYNFLLFSGPNGESERAWQAVLTEQSDLTPCKWLMHADLFPPHPDGGADNSGPVDAGRVARTIRGFRKGTAVVVNLENGGYDTETRYWNLWNKQGMGASPVGVRHRKELLEFLKLENPFCRYGYYGQIPYPGDWNLCGNHKDIERGRQMLLEWKPVADEADFLVPQIYTNSDWTEAFTLRYIAEAITSCRGYYRGKKIYPVVWMCHYDLVQKVDADNDHTQERFRATLVPYWESMLRMAYSLGDGVIVWGGHRFPWTDGEWWQITKQLPKRRVTWTYPS